MASRTTARRSVGIVFGLTATLLALRLAVNLTHEGYLGIDGGAYLLHAKRLLGLELPQIDFNRPILGPGWLLIPFIEIWGNDVGYKVWGAIFSVLPLIPAGALLAHRLLPRKQALLATLLLALNPWHWEMVVSGSLPLIGIALIMLALWGLIPIAAGKGTRWDKLAVVGSIALIPYINQTSTGLAAVSIPTFILAAMYFRRSLRPLKAAFPYLLTGALLALPAILLYYGDVAFGGDRMTFPGPKVFIWPKIHAGLLVTFYGFTIAYGVIRYHPSPTIKALACVLAIHSFLPLFASYDEAIINIFFRSQHLASGLMILLGVWYVTHSLSKLNTASLTRLGTAAAAMLLIFSIWTFYRQTDYSDMVTPDMDRARGHIPSEYAGAIMVNGFLTGLWVAALEERPTVWTFTADPPPMWQVQYARTRCVLGWRTDCDPKSEAAILETEYILIDTRFPYITKQEPNLWGAPDDTWGTLETADWLILEAHYGTVKLWRVT